MNFDRLGTDFKSECWQTELRLVYCYKAIILNSNNIMQVHAKRWISVVLVLFSQIIHQEEIVTLHSSKNIHMLENRHLD